MTLDNPGPNTDTEAFHTMSDITKTSGGRFLVTAKSDAEVLAALPDAAELSERAKALCKAILDLRTALPYPDNVPAGYERVVSGMLWQRFCSPHTSRNVLGDSVHVPTSRLDAVISSFDHAGWLPDYDYPSAASSTAEAPPDAAGLADLLATIVNEIKALEDMTAAARAAIYDDRMYTTEGYARVLLQAVADLVWNRSLLELRCAVLELLALLPQPSVPLAGGVEPIPARWANPPSGADDSADDIPF